MQQDRATTAYDRDLQSRVIDTIRNSGRPELKQISIQAADGCVILVGRVSTYFAKQIAQTLVRDVNGVQSIRNDIDVQRNMPPYRVS